MHGDLLAPRGGAETLEEAAIIIFVEDRTAVDATQNHVGDECVALILDVDALVRLNRKAA